MPELVTESASWRRRLKRLTLILGLLAFAGWLISGGLAAWMLTRRPRPLFEEPIPKSLPLVEAMRLQTSDGESLGAWYLAPPSEKPVVILLHGIGDSRTGSVGMLRSLRQEGLGGLAVSQRAHGDSTGTSCDVGWSGRHDVIAAVSTIERLAPKSPIIVFGVSMGAAASIFASKELDHRVAGYILESPYANLDVAVRVRVEPMVQQPFAWIALNALRIWAPLFLGVRLTTVSPAHHIRDIPADIPVLLLAGGADVLASQKDVEEMARNAGPHARLVVFPEAGHVQLGTRYPAEYGAALESFLTEVAQREATKQH